MTNETNNSGWNFDNTYAQLPKTFYTSQNPIPVRSPKLIIFNNSLATSLGLNVETLEKEEGVFLLETGFPKALHRLLKHMRGINLVILLC